MWVLFFIFHSHKNSIAASAHTHTLSIHTNTHMEFPHFFSEQITTGSYFSSQWNVMWVFGIAQNRSVRELRRIKVCLADIWSRSSDIIVWHLFVCSFRMSQPPCMLLLLKPERLSDYLCILPLLSRGIDL